MMAGPVSDSVSHSDSHGEVVSVSHSASKADQVERRASKAKAAAPEKTKSKRAGPPAAKAQAKSESTAAAKPVAARTTRKPVAAKTVAAKSATGKSTPAKPAAAAKTAPAPAKKPSAAKPVRKLSGPRGGAADKLTLVKGIGPVNERKLNEHGIYHFDQIAAWTKADIAAVEAYLAFDGRIAREDWIGQAKKLAKAQAKPAPKTRGAK